MLTRDDAKQNKRAKKVASAYVNPFGDYLNGAILEIDSYEDPGQRSSARIAYEKARKLHPNCKVLSKAIKDMNRAPKGRVVHVFMADGFAPEKEIKKRCSHFRGAPDRETATYHSIPTRFSYGDVVYGKSVKRLEILSDIRSHGPAPRNR